MDLSPAPPPRLSPAPPPRLAFAVEQVKAAPASGETGDAPTVAPGGLRTTGRSAKRQLRIADSERRRALREPAAAAANADGPVSAADAWDAFYGAKRDTFFKDRHLLRAEFPELMPAAVRADPKAHCARLNEQAQLPSEGSGGRPLVFVEAGCGVGNALFPVLRANPNAFGYGFDLSSTAISILRTSPEFLPNRADAFVGRLDQPETYVKRIACSGRPVDYVVVVWALSALKPDAGMAAAARGLASLLRAGGMLLFRDYADGDMRMEKFARRDANTNSGGTGVERMFLRGDHTVAYFFTVAEVEMLFESAGLKTVECRIEERVAENRKTGAVMNRRWLVGRFRKPDCTVTVSL
jgi:SAM-dependent methyltransferase